jgi:hypothetical protein
MIAVRASAVAVANPTAVKHPWPQSSLAPSADMLRTRLGPPAWRIAVVSAVVGVSYFVMWAWRSVRRFKMLRSEHTPLLPHAAN